MSDHRVAQVGDPGDAGRTLDRGADQVDGRRRRGRDRRRRSLPPDDADRGRDRGQVPATFSSGTSSLRPASRACTRSARDPASRAAPRRACGPSGRGSGPGAPRRASAAGARRRGGSTSDRPARARASRSRARQVRRELERPLDAAAAGGGKYIVTSRTFTAADDRDARRGSPRSRRSAGRPAGSFVSTQWCTCRARVYGSFAFVFATCGTGQRDDVHRRVGGDAVARLDRREHDRALGHDRPQPVDQARRERAGSACDTRAPVPGAVHEHRQREAAGGRRAQPVPLAQARRDGRMPTASAARPPTSAIHVASAGPPCRRPYSKSPGQRRCSDDAGDERERQDEQRAGEQRQRPDEHERQRREPGDPPRLRERDGIGEVHEQPRHRASAPGSPGCRRGRTSPSGGAPRAPRPAAARARRPRRPAAAEHLRRQSVVVVVRDDELVAVVTERAQTLARAGIVRDRLVDDRLQPEQREPGRHERRGEQRRRLRHSSTRSTAYTASGTSTNSP